MPQCCSTANPKAAGVRKGFDDPYSNYGHYSRLEADGLSDWYPAFPQLAPTLTGRISQCIGQQALPLNLPILQYLPEQWQQIAQQFRHCNAPRWNDDGALNSS